MESFIYTEFKDLKAETLQIYLKDSEKIVNLSPYTHTVEFTKTGIIVNNINTMGRYQEIVRRFIPIDNILMIKSIRNETIEGEE